MSKETSIFDGFVCPKCGKAMKESSEYEGERVLTSLKCEDCKVEYRCKYNTMHECAMRDSAGLRQKARAAMRCSFYSSTKSVQSKYYPLPGSLCRMKKSEVSMAPWGILVPNSVLEELS